MITREISRTIGVRGAGLGAHPTDFELSRVYGYTPVHSGWINQGNGQFTPALGDASSDVVHQLELSNKRALILGVISTTAVVATAVVSIWKMRPWTRRR